MNNFIKLTFLFLLTQSWATESTFLKDVSDLNLSLETLIAKQSLPTDYRSYMDLYSQKHSDFIKIRTLWNQILLKLPTSSNEVEKQIIAELAENKFLQQLSLDEVGYFSYVYEAWANSNECTTRIIPTITAMNQIYGIRKAPFGFAQKSSTLVAYYLSYKPSAQNKSIHSCFKSHKLEEGVTFLNVSPLTMSQSDGSDTKVLFDENIAPGNYLSNGEEIQVLNSKIGIGLHVYNFCYARSSALEGKCFNDFGRVSSARRD